MNWVSETQKALSKALARVILPEILLPALLVDGGFGALALLLAIRVVGRLPASPAQARDFAGGGLLIALIAIIAVPAIASGLYSVTRAVVVYGRGRWSDFWSGLGTYWWRLVGLSLLATLALTAVGIAVGFGMISNSFGQIPRLEDFLYMRTTSLVLLGLYFVARYFVTPVIPAMVIEQTSAVESIGLGFRFAWKNPSIVAPAVAIDAAVAWVVQRIRPPLDAAMFGQGLGAGVVFVVLMMVAISAVVSAFFKLLHLGIYHDNVLVPVAVTDASVDTCPDKAPGLEPESPTSLEGTGLPEQGPVGTTERPVEESEGDREAEPLSEDPDDMSTASAGAEPAKHSGSTEPTEASEPTESTEPAEPTEPQ